MRHWQQWCLGRCLFACGCAWLAGRASAAAGAAGGARGAGSLGWVEDAAWYDARVASDAARAPGGCCPAAVAVYENRYAATHFRCCAHGVGKFRPVGGATWADHLKRNGTSSLLLSGDSLSEQHFLALLCLAWAEGLPVAGPRSLSPPGEYTPNWRAVVAERVEVTFLRSDIPLSRPGIDFKTPTHVVLSGWHHGGTEKLAAYFSSVSSARAGRPTLVVEALPAHFPGNIYRKSNKYPAVTSSVAGAVCSPGSNATTGNGVDVNAHLAAMLHGLPGFRLLSVHRLYALRGDAHVGVAANRWNISSRDCLHWCVLPGVLDALALGTLAAFGG
ncbi:hypothetical protein M885DRAFT_574132 [Pelagophyceae sp. CCMP2097]|nr:hypothetical protein M885DRAFT_574132 [Pelagophyceae sp. CCMP2097]